MVQVKNKFLNPTPMGYRDLNLALRVRLNDASRTGYICEVQINHALIIEAKEKAHAHYEIIRSRLPELCRGTPVDADKLESFISGRLNNSALDSAVAALSLRADGLFLYAHLLAEHLERAGGEIDFGSLDALPAGLGEVYATNFRRAFPDGADDDGWAAALPLVELVAAAPEPMKVETAKAMLGITGDARVFELTSLFFPVRDDLIHVLHKTVRRKGKEESEVGDSDARLFSRSSLTGSRARSTRRAASRRAPRCFASTAPKAAASSSVLSSSDAARIAAYFEEHDLPRHPLVARGFPSIGCEPCTHKVAPGEDPRSGRWKGWDKVECGIHKPGEEPFL
mgnify:CR=1 FL=1